MNEAEKAQPQNNLEPEGAEIAEDGFTPAQHEETAGAAQPAAEDPTLALTARVKDLEDRLLRQAAEFENYKKRALAETQNRLKYGPADLIRDLLTGLDNLERALAHAQEQSKGNEALSQFVSGIAMVQTQLFETLRKNNVERIYPLGEKFDPNLHEAVGMVASSEFQNDHVALVMQAGYKLHERVIRPSMVQVARKE
ncbi:MAG: nucleotide exchange factor GrpE [Candidatus Lambdaproteobacteria bacterium RIFOXYD1_FULL_56_27]|uniref:Protein GrpE n=1 Tax=Candidatus Lambdaproteobacteria bacterium RIFOXYD2_FULL_56_26 TaxID=1817773 RepID=A0A1F6GPM7_9PROT|nr:MAG: nucleotide exchange factor GrpE [Candidatus Lambdaproteobacteria bacterium RIFOXYD2_FULL_56_26]OGH03931.1 MAG: nucleotide exchange factor GrpE [Candidatus Lambdaproteobacteria bacterium RIFOXYC1_FULL_56_13]OGH06188.1 MAG: nucleotide exchange factor GrpE [Candidatus Lambdaproteobacteria bacterium RIFOXYD1_FULL_56_27]